MCQNVWERGIGDFNNHIEKCGDCRRKVQEVQEIANRTKDCPICKRNIWFYVPKCTYCGTWFGTA